MAELRFPVNAYRFGPFRLSVPDRILERDGERIQLTPKVIDTLFVLVENAKQVISKEDLIKAVWPDVNVVESGLTRNISSLRKALEEGQEEGSFIETIPRRGYRFVAQVTAEVEAESAPVPLVEEKPEVLVPSPAAETLLQDQTPAPIEAEHRPRARRVAIGVAVAIAAAVFLIFLNRERVTTTPTRSEPTVRIGEHLLYKLAPEETIRASEHFERAIATNPGSAGAHAGLSISLLNLAMLGVRPSAEVLPRAEGAARRALELAPNSGMAHYALALIHTTKDWNFGKADAEFRRALELEPTSVQARLGYARLKFMKGQLAESQRLVEDALRLDPASPSLGMEYCRVFYYLRDFSRAELECRKVLDREPGYALAHYYLGLALGSLGRIGDARQSLERSALRPGVLEADFAWLSLLEGDRKPALAVLEARRELIRDGKTDATAKLLLAAILGNIDEAYEALEVGIARRAPELLTVHIEPRLDSIRADPRYQTILRRVGLQQ